MPPRFINNTATNCAIGFSAPATSDAEFEGNQAIGSTKVGFLVEGDSTALTTLIAEIKQALADSQFDSDKPRVEQAIETIENASPSAKSTPGLLAGSFTALRDFAAKAIGTAVGTSVISYLRMHGVSI